MEIRGSDGIPFIQFSTGYVILLQTVQLLCIDCRLCIDCALAVHQFIPLLLCFPSSREDISRFRVNFFPFLIIPGGGWFVSLSPSFLTCLTLIFKLIMPAPVMSPVNAIVSVSFFCSFINCLLLTCSFLRLIFLRSPTGPTQLWRLISLV